MIDSNGLISKGIKSVFFVGAAPALPPNGSLINQKTQEVGLPKIAADQGLKSRCCSNTITVNFLAVIVTSPLTELFVAHAAGKKTTQQARKELKDSTVTDFIDLALIIKNKFKTDSKTIKGYIESFFILSEGELAHYREPFFKSFASLKKSKSGSEEKNGANDLKSEEVGNVVTRARRSSDHPATLLEPDFCDPNYQPDLELQVYILNCIPNDTPPFDYTYIFNPIAQPTENVLDQTFDALIPSMKRFENLRLANRLYLPDPKDLPLTIRYYLRKGIGAFYIKTSNPVTDAEVDQLQKKHSVKIFKIEF